MNTETPKNQDARPADEKAAALSDHPSYWLVESTNGCGWWDGRFLGRGIDPRFFTLDPNEAVRFARKEDAERVCVQSSAIKATEHIWIDRTAAADAAALSGMPPTQEPKYGIRDNRLYNRASGEFIPADEPVFIFRARDMKAVRALRSYGRMFEWGTGHREAVNDRANEFEAFATAHPERMKEPDTDRASAVMAGAQWERDKSGGRNEIFSDGLNKPGETPPIDYSVLHAFADSQRISYNDLCAMVRDAVRATAMGAGDLSDRDLMLEWDRHYIPGKKDGTPSLNIVVKFARTLLARPTASGAACLSDDTARLDWLVSEGADIEEIGGNRYRVHWSDPECWQQDFHPDPRAAIDAARRAANGAGGQS